MRRLAVVTLVSLPFILAACSGRSKSPSSETPAPTAQSQNQTGPMSPHKPTLLVSKLPAGAEGVELAEGGLRILKGYEFIRDTDSTFIIARMTERTRTGGTGTGGGCGCKGGTGGCVPANQGGIIVCQADSSCTNCGLALTIGGVSTMIFRY